MAGGSELPVAARPGLGALAKDEGRRGDFGFSCECEPTQGPIRRIPDICFARKGQEGGFKRAAGTIGWPRRFAIPASTWRPRVISSRAGFGYEIKAVDSGWAWVAYDIDGAVRQKGWAPQKALAAACVIRALARAATQEPSKAAA
jgi:hypothetical protein